MAWEKCPSTKVTYLYALSDPTGNIRYIGKSDNPKQRLKRHLKPTGTTHKEVWINHLLAHAAVPKLKILRLVPEFEWAVWERFYIEYYRNIGHDLTNTAEGGVAGPNTEESLRKMVATRRTKGNYQHTEEYKQAMRTRFSGKGNPMYGKKLSTETRALIGAKSKERNCKPVIDITDTELIVYKSLSDVANVLGIYNSRVTKALKKEKTLCGRKLYYYNPTPSWVKCRQCFGEAVCSTCFGERIVHIESGYPPSIHTKLLTIGDIIV